MSGRPLFFCRPSYFPPKIGRPSSFAQKFLTYIATKFLQKRLFKSHYRIIRIKYNYRISFSSKIDLNINKNRTNQKKSGPS